MEREVVVVMEDVSDAGQGVLMLENARTDPANTPPRRTNPAETPNFK